ncbi:hypothetical protein EVG20_g2294 [Dentipellis fragilis]|uniref:Acyl-CoA dehydrogenase NM domain-like protein n=1 Tax=Dentipellis fragilis TaxID=205917 RepID=A0A4Y9Z9M7_9AGAM|nr:hypothetical protein EVG20_g2294 [Dentipellis fragilis]
MNSPFPTHCTTALAQSPLFRLQTEGLPSSERVRLSYQRARAVVQTYNLTADDILNVTPRYWEFHTDPILSQDISVGTLLTIHYNLCSGTIALFASGRPDLERTLQQLLSYEVSGQYLLTEIGHGLNAINLETTCTMLSNGEFELNTPSAGAAKFMPPTTPCGVPCVAVVMARLVVGGEDRGVKPFVVPLHDGERMHTGIVSKLLTPRGGSRPVNHALTYFHHVRLPPTALLASPEKASRPRDEFFFNISRVISGTLSMGALGLSAMRIGSYVAGQYSLRRTVVDAGSGLTRPIASFSTQYTPVLTAIAQTMVFQAFAQEARARFADKSASLPMKHFVAAVFKTTVIKHTKETLLGLGDRCGAQGLFEINQLSVLHADMRGAAIAEGDLLAISIRFAMDLLLGRIKAPATPYPDSVLYKHEQSLIAHLTKVLSQARNHRDARTEAILLPQCPTLIEAIGHRLAYDAAMQAGMDKDVVELYVASVMPYDAGWYSENLGIPCWEQKMQLLGAAKALYPQLEALLELLKVKSYATAPIVSDQAWEGYVESLDTFGNPQPCSPTVSFPDQQPQKQQQAPLPRDHFVRAHL